MAQYWITTHWPSPPTEPGQSRHVFVKDHNVSVPAIGDFIFFRESVSATVNGRRVRSVIRHHRGQQARFELPSGSGGIIGTATVVGTRRPISPEDVVFDYGDLKEWSVISCDGFQPAYLSLSKLRNLLRTDTTRFLSLWRIPDEETASNLLREIRRVPEPREFSAEQINTWIAEDEADMRRFRQGR